MAVHLIFDTRINEFVTAFEEPTDYRGKRPPDIHPIF